MFKSLEKRDNMNLSSAMGPNQLVKRSYFIDGSSSNENNLDFLSGV